MKFASFRNEDGIGIAASNGGEWRTLGPRDAGFPGTLGTLIAGGAEAVAEAGRLVIETGRITSPQSLELLTPLVPGKILCVGLNYADHAAEANMTVPDDPTLFSRFASTLVAPGAPIRMPRVSTALDFEGELAVVIGAGGRYISKGEALGHVAGYSCFNDASIRDYQLRTTQWMLGKNFDGTGPFGPYLVTPDELPAGASGLKIETRLNGETVQKSSTDQLIFDVATLIAAISDAMTLEPGDVIITGTPAGVGNARTPKLFMKPGDRCEVEIEGIGILSNPIAADV